MDPWLALAIRKAEPATCRVILRRQRSIMALRDLDLRDRWGYELGADKLAAIADFVVLNVDHANLGVRNKASAVMAEIVDRVQLDMAVGDLPMFCDGPDTPPEDDSVQTVVRTILAPPPRSA